MIESFALLPIVAAGAWLGFVAVLCAAAPERALHYLSLMASTRRINLLELGIRGAVGAAMVLRAPASIAPQFFELAGWFLAITAALILAVPRERHAAFARAAARRIPKPVVRWLVAPIALAGGIALLWAAL